MSKFDIPDKSEKNRSKKNVCKTVNDFVRMMFLKMNLVIFDRQKCLGKIKRIKTQCISKGEPRDAIRFFRSCSQKQF